MKVQIVNKDLQKIFDSLKESQQETLHLHSRVLLVDSMNTFLRSFVMIKHLNPDGHHVGGLTGYLKSIGYAIRTIKPTRVILVFDGLGGSTAKRNLYPDYKGNRKLNRITNWEGFDSREEESEAITNQIIRLISYLKTLPVDLLMVDKIEADDVVGYLSKVLEEEVYIYSSDNDYLQLVNDKVTLYSPIKKKFYKPETVVTELGIPPINYLNYKILAGDSSDNIPGIRGLQMKKILKLYPELKQDRRYSLEEIIQMTKEREDINKLYTKVLLYEKQLVINQTLMNLHEPLISESNKQEIEEVLESPKKSLEAKNFITLYNTDMLGGALANPQMWLHDTFHYLTAYKKKVV